MKIYTVHKRGGILFKLFYKVAKVSPARFFLQYLFALMVSLCMVASTVLMRYTFDTAVGVASGEKALDGLLIGLGLMWVIKAVSDISDGISNYYGEDFYYVNIQTMMSEIHEKAALLPALAYEDTSKLEAIEKAVEGATSTRQLLNILMDIVFLYLPYLLAIGFYLYRLKASLVIILVLLFVPVVLGQWLKVRLHVNQEDALASHRRKKEYFASCVGSREWVKETRTHGAVDTFIKRFHEALHLFNTEKWALSKRLLRLDTFLGLFSFLGYAFSIGILIWSVFKGEISVGAFAAVFASLSQMHGLLNELFVFRLSACAREMGKIKKYRAFLSLEEVADLETVCENKELAVALKGVNFSYPGRERVLSNIHLDIKKGERLAIVGANGSGKSTLVRLLMGIYPPETGDWVSHFSGGHSAVFQNFNRYKMSVLENVKISDFDAQDQKGHLERVLKAVHMDEVIEKLPKGLHTMLAPEFGGVDLSGGQWQRLAIARGMYKSYDFIALDEPTSAIDALEEAKLYKHFLDLTQSKTSVIVTHRLGLVHSCDRIVVMDGGEIVALGTHEALMKSSALYQDMWAASL